MGDTFRSQPIENDDIPKAGEPGPKVDLNKPMPATRGDTGEALDGRKGRVFAEGARRPLAADTATDDEGQPVSRHLDEPDRRE